MKKIPPFLSGKTFAILANPRKLRFPKEVAVLTYLVSRDALLLALVVFPLLLIVEGILPGFLSAHLSIGQFAIVAVALALFNAFLAKQLGLSFTPLKLRHNKLVPPLVIFSLLLLGNAMLKFALWENMLIAAATLVILWLIMEEI